MTNAKRLEPAHIGSVTLTCRNDGCDSQLSLPSGTADEFLDAFEAKHFDGWLCLVKEPFDVTCPSCNEKEFRSIQRHQVLREKLRDLPQWKRDVALAVWAAMPGVQDQYLRETEMPIALRALLGKEKTPDSSHVRHALEQIERAFSRRPGPNAAEASRLAKVALGR